jgi:hypothetical protein
MPISIEQQYVNIIGGKSAFGASSALPDPRAPRSYVALAAQLQAADRMLRVLEPLIPNVPRNDPSITKVLHELANYAGFWLDGFPHYTPDFTYRAELAANYLARHPEGLGRSAFLFWLKKGRAMAQPEGITFIAPPYVLAFFDNNGRAEPKPPNYVVWRSPCGTWKLEKINNPLSLHELGKRLGHPMANLYRNPPMRGDDFTQPADLENLCYWRAVDAGTYSLYGFMEGDTYTGCLGVCAGKVFEALHRGGHDVANTAFAHALAALNTAHGPLKFEDPEGPPAFISEAFKEIARTPDGLPWTPGHHFVIPPRTYQSSAV